MLCFPPASGGPCVDSSTALGLTLNVAFVVLCVLFVVIWAILFRRLWRAQRSEAEEDQYLFGRPLGVLFLIWLGGMVAVEVAGYAGGS